MFSPQDHHHMLPYGPGPLPADLGNRWKPGVEVAPNCPRCDSSNTKFCYYNNYSLTQPRYFCKGCRRYWTKGGSLRNVPIGGGCRKNRRSKTAGRQSHSQSRPNSLRPDLALDRMVGDSHSHSSIGDSGTTDGSPIDLALLYAKFLNHCPELSLDELLAGTSNCTRDEVPVQLPAQAQAQAQGLELDDGIIQGGDLGLSADPTGYESLAFTDGGVSDVFLTNCSMVPNLTWQGAEYQGFQPIPENTMFHHHQDVLIGDWSALNQSNFDPILM